MIQNCHEKMIDFNGGIWYNKAEKERFPPMKQKTLSPAKQRVWKKVMITALVLLGISVFLVLADLIAASVLIYNWTHPEKVVWDTSPAEYGLDYHAFELKTSNGTVYGWKIAAQQPIDDEAEEWVYTTEYSDKTVVLASNYDSNRQLNDLGGVDYMVELCAAGYNVITFDWTGSGFSDGKKNVFALDKTEELKEVIAFAAQETGADFIAVQGIGFGCYPAAAAAAECDAVDALILDSCYEDFSGVFYDNFGTWSPVNITPVRETVRILFPLFSGVDVDEITLADPINALSGKDVLFIQGEQDEIFGSADAQHLLALAQTDNDASLWLVSDVTHLRARSYDRETYFSKISQFLADAYEADHIT